MKYLLKFNESVSELTKADIDKIEDLFLDWNPMFEAPSFLFSQPLLDQINDGWKNLGYFVIYLSPLDDNGIFVKTAVPIQYCYGSRQYIWHIGEEYMNEIGFVSALEYSVSDAGQQVKDGKHEYPLITVDLDGKYRYPDRIDIDLESMADIDNLFTDSGKFEHHQLFKFLDKYCNIHNSMREIMGRTRGLKHYGYNSLVKLNAVGRTVMRGSIDPKEQKGGLDITLFLKIYVKKPEVRGGPFLL